MTAANAKAPRGCGRLKPYTVLFASSATDD
jgi:hypothetical protein